MKVTKSKKLNSPKQILLSDETFPKKSLGQNFLIDLEVLNLIEEISELTKNDEVLEIGAGLGTLTRFLAVRTKRVVAVEKDKRLFEKLKEYLSQISNIELILDDALKIDFKRYIKRKKMKVVSNLPYSVSSPIIIRLLENKDLFSVLALMIQREVGERISAKPGGKVYGSISVLAQTFMEVSIELLVPPEAFWPKPKVDSVVLKLVPLIEPTIKIPDEKLFKKIVRAAFSSRRKILANSLCSLFSKDIADELLKSAGIDRKRRAETLSIVEFGRLTEEAFRIYGDH